MRSWFAVWGLCLAFFVPGSPARALCQDGGIPPLGGCNFTVELAPLPARTTVPLLELNAVVTDDGTILHMGGPVVPGTVVVMVQGPGPNGGGTLVFPDGGTVLSYSPFGAQLTLVDHVEDAGTTYSFWKGATSLFEGLNTLTATATEYGGLSEVSSAPQTVFLDFGAAADAGPDGGSDGGATDSGAPSTPDGGGGAGDGGDGGGGGGSSSSSQSGCGCSATGDASPAPVLMALALMLLGLRRRAIRG